MPRKPKLKTCDIFWFPLYNGKFGFGQIFGPAQYSTLPVIVFDCFSNDKTYSAEAILTSKVVLLGYAGDELFYHKDWGVSGNLPRTFEFLQLPTFKMGSEENLKIVDFWGNIIRKGKPNEFDKFSYMFSLSAIGFQEAMDIYHGKQEWNEDMYGKILYRPSFPNGFVPHGQQ